ncbi:MAG: UbiA prenyltransferase family protein [Bacteroidota bacterium]
MKDHLALLRPHQYVKNAFLFLPAFFALQITRWEVVWPVSLGVLAFSMLASSVYILNDYRDREDDRKHPRKKDRPLAAGTVSPRTAFIMMGVLWTTSLGIFFWLDLYAFFWVLGYWLMNVLYSQGLKHIPILDISIIATGFVIRVVVGSLVVEEPIALSMWIVLMTFLGALFLALAKRRDDVLLAEEGNKVRKSIDGYNLEFINGAMMIMASVLIVSYISYVSATEVQENLHSNQLYVTVLFVILGVLRYMQITFVEERSGSPTRILLGDRFIQLTLLGWVLTYVVLIYL